MKRAILATAGTLTGLVSVLSYTPTSATTPLAQGGAGAAGLGGPGLSAPAGNEAPAGSGGAAVAAQSTKGGTAATSSAKAATARPAPKPAARPAGAARPATRPTSAATSAAAAPTTQATVAAAAPKTTAAAAPKPTTAAPKPVVTKTTSQAPAPTPTVTVAKDYIGSAVAYKYGTLQIGIRVQGGKIIDAWAVKYPMGESQPYSEMAIPILRSQTLAAQSARISGASGATLTSQSWIKSLTAALSLAGL